jgi:hypothetical protein
MATFDSLIAANKRSCFPHSMSVVAYRINVPCEKMALVPFPHTGRYHGDHELPRQIPKINVPGVLGLL